MITSNFKYVALVFIGFLIGTASTYIFTLKQSIKMIQNKEVQVNEYQIQRSITFCRGNPVGEEPNYNAIDFLVVSDSETKVMCENGANTALPNGFKK